MRRRKWRRRWRNIESDDDDAAADGRIGVPGSASEECGGERGEKEKWGAR